MIIDDVTIESTGAPVINLKVLVSPYEIEPGMVSVYIQWGDEGGRYYCWMGIVASGQRCLTVRTMAGGSRIEVSRA